MKIWTKLISILKQYMKILYCKWKFGQNYISTFKVIYYENFVLQMEIWTKLRFNIKANIWKFCMQTWTK